MGYIYSDRDRVDDPHALANIEVWYMEAAEAVEASKGNDWEDFKPGWYWRAGFPGCLPDGDPIGRFATEDEAIYDAQEFEQIGKELG